MTLCRLWNAVHCSVWPAPDYLTGPTPTLLTDDPALWVNRSPRKISFAQTTSPFAPGGSSGVAAAADAALMAVSE